MVFSPRHSCNSDHLDFNPECWETVTEAIKSTFWRKSRVALSHARAAVQRRVTVSFLPWKLANPDPPGLSVGSSPLTPLSHGLAAPPILPQLKSRPLTTLP